MCGSHITCNIWIYVLESEKQKKTEFLQEFAILVFQLHSSKRESSVDSKAFCR
jgi:hypothetical protein